MDIYTIVGLIVITLFLSGIGVSGYLIGKSKGFKEGLLFDAEIKNIIAQDSQLEEKEDDNRGL